MEVDSDRHLPTCQVLPEVQNRLRPLWLEVGAGLFPGIVGGPSPCPSAAQCLCSKLCPGSRKDIDKQCPDYSWRFNLWRAQNSKDIILKAWVPIHSWDPLLPRKIAWWCQRTQGYGMWSFVHPDFLSNQLVRGNLRTAAWDKRVLILGSKIPRALLCHWREPALFRELGAEPELCLCLVGTRGSWEKGNAK